MGIIQVKKVGYFTVTIETEDGTLRKVYKGRFLRWLKKIKLYANEIDIYRLMRREIKQEKREQKKAEKIQEEPAQKP